MTRDGQPYLVMLTAGGQVTPRVVRVPAFISVRVELRARDDGPYILEIDGQRIEVGGSVVPAVNGSLIIET